MEESNHCIVIGGGAAGFFGAVTAAEALRAAGQRPRVLLLEASPNVLSKVRISGGGRCNVTHACFEPKELVTRYPRGGRELLGPFHRFGPRDTVAWFGRRGVSLKTEEDGRMFPTSDRSTTIIAALTTAADEAKVRVRTRASVTSWERAGEAGFLVRVGDEGEVLRTRTLLLATGGTRSGGGETLAVAAGHSVAKPVPSLFTFQIRDPRLQGISGVSVEQVKAHVPGTKLESSGPLLVTHEGLSGPAILKLSAWGARVLADRNYAFAVRISFVPGKDPASVLAQLNAQRDQNGRKTLRTWCPFDVPLRLWERLVHAAGAQDTLTWSAAPRTLLEAVANQLTAAEFQVIGKSLNKDEFVTCGGVALSEVDFRTMESRKTPGLYFAGEVLDIDGVTGGFNFQAAWTTGWHAGNAIAEVCM